ARHTGGSANGPAWFESEGPGLARRRPPHTPRDALGGPTPVTGPASSQGERREDGDGHAQVYGSGHVTIVTVRCNGSLVRVFFFCLRH
ncbi:unnamed protein product, partial [Ectocarpus sp. 12 AP-2014]